ncbi:DUF885 domain-containing protein [Sphingomonas morindae]|uniref:DUF885 family protein n=1 Tax=Sphingomonas morindae TaxID=1541170 RepID=A0ABY4X5L2_9SPHN|nr:DUF885 family protein [Sphingomonas morindae]USI72140.1 DUF885 family protein [Sphingomonas morindae]
MLSRRTFLLASAAGGAAVATAGLHAAPAPAAGRDPEFAQLLDQFFREGLRQRPEGATQLGLDTGADADLRARLSDVSDAGRAAARALNRAQLARLAAIDPARLGAADRLDYDVVLYTRRATEAVQAFDFGGAGYGPSPYVVSQITGAYQSVPDFLDTKHPIATAADAEAYLSRLAGFAAQLDAETGRMRHDAGAGVAPPDFLLDLTLKQLTALRVPASQALLVQSIARRAAAKGLSPRYADQAARLYTATILPALDRQIAEARALRAGATHEAGVWRLPQGAEFYAVALRTTTTSSRSAEEVHRFGLDQAQAIRARLDQLLRAQGFSKGTIGARMAALYKDPSQLYPNTDAGKAAAIAYCNDRLAAIRTRLPSVFSRVPDYGFEVRRVPPQTELGAASAFSQPPALDGSRPGLVYFNLHDTAEWPKFCLATTVFHEGLPGHQFEGGLALSNRDLPLIRKTGGFSGYGEGWALYAEQLADEMGLYDADPLGRLGYLKFQLFRANRCVVDTGIHRYRWGREQAIAYFVEQEGEAPGFAAREVERYCATPGQACAYKLGHSVFTGLRSQAQAQLGPRFDIKAFHDAVLAPGRVPLDILQQTGERWLAAQARA